MARQATGQLRDDIDLPEEEAEAFDPTPSSDDGTPTAAEFADDVQDIELSPLETAPKRKTGGGILLLVIIAMIGMAVGFIAVMLV